MQYVKGMSKKFMAIMAFPAFGMAEPAYAQMTCGEATSQLQQYVGQVNQVANYWYMQGIAQTCYGNQVCAAGMLQQLNWWYQQQASMVNQWYYKISLECTHFRPDASDLPGRGARAGRSEINEDAVENMEVDDEDQTVAIVIPDTPRGFNPRR